MADETLTAEATGTDAAGQSGAGLEGLIAADAAEHKLDGQPRGEDGRFAGANEGQRAGQSTDDEAGGDEEATAAAAAAEAAASAPKSETANGNTTETPKAESRAKGAKDAKAEAEPEDEKGKTPYQKAQIRLDKSWKKLNAEKAELETRTAALQAREQGLAQQAQARPAAATGNGKAFKFTPDQYRGYAQKCVDQAADLERQAAQLETTGDFDGADKALEKAKELRETAKAAAATAQEAAQVAQVAQPAGGGGAAGASNEELSKAAWATIRADLPEILQHGSELNGAFREFIKANPGVMAGPDGVFRAVLQVGRAQVRRLEQVAGRVPELEKQLATATAKIKELEQATSLPGGDSYNRGGNMGGGGGAEPGTEAYEEQLARALGG